MNMALVSRSISRRFLGPCGGKAWHVCPQILEETGVLGPDVVAAHCIDLTDDDVAILARNKVNIAHTPMTNSFGGNGVARIPYMMEQGLNITLGHDCFFTLDIAEYLRYTFLLHKAYNANAGLLPIFQVLDFALGNAARALGMEGQIGSLTVGKKADISSSIQTVPPQLHPALC